MAAADSELLGSCTKTNRSCVCTCFVSFESKAHGPRPQNRMHEALQLWQSICNSRWFRDTALILFLNKVDLFRDKIDRSPIDKFFPEYRGHSFEDACRFFTDAFVGLNRNRQKKIYDVSVVLVPFARQLPD
jgi:hypothetical protein